MALRDELFDAVERELSSILHSEAHQRRKIVSIYVDRVVHRFVDAVEPGQKGALTAQVFVEGFVGHLQAKLCAGRGVPMQIFCRASTAACVSKLSCLRANSRCSSGLLVTGATWPGTCK